MKRNRIIKTVSAIILKNKYTMKTFLHTITLAFFLSFGAHAAYGQVDRNVIYKVAVGDFAYTVKEKKPTVGDVLATVADAVSGKTSRQQTTQYADAVRAGIVSGLGHAVRFRTIDGGFQEGELAADEPAFYADGTIVNISTVTKTEPSTVKNKPAQTYYRSLISVTVNLKDAHDDTVADSHTFNITDSDVTWLSSAEKAMSDALNRLTGKVSSYYNRLFPLSASIIEGGDTKKDKQKEVYIDLGSSNGVYKGQHFDVFHVKNVAGKEARVEIGRLKIEEIEGEEVSLCKVTRGGEQIKKALAEGVRLVVTSR